MRVYPTNSITYNQFFLDSEYETWSNVKNENLLKARDSVKRKNWKFQLAAVQKIREEKIICEKRTYKYRNNEKCSAMKLRKNHPLIGRAPIPAHILLSFGKLNAICKIMLLITLDTIECWELISWLFSLLIWINCWCSIQHWNMKCFYLDIEKTTLCTCTISDTVRVSVLLVWNNMIYFSWKYLTISYSWTQFRRTIFSKKKRFL